MNKKRITNNKIILASKSESRKRILKNTKIPFRVVAPKIKEGEYKNKFKKKGLSYKNITKKLAEIKCRDVSKKHPKNIVVACDTMIELNNKIFNKAKNLKEAKNKIKKLSGKGHNIYSSVCVIKNNKIIWSFGKNTKVWIRSLKNEDVDSYLSKSGSQILKSVGCYQAEKMGPLIISKISGDFYNVLGFPVLDFIKFIKKTEPDIL
ncbi:MAG: Septum formation protein Maf [Alphaproteobacteria bacterium MarineAlpha5_Bin11]|nr:MAG: Septum formation protein Maf [Alphaproteobacteria bacterium MarineAlpha5_Bin11]PPR51842.1 MAG: Septum formation protein Maf [Alphaproteobacteria bacterium MarineAlpha5_Bin10]